MKIVKQESSIITASELSRTPSKTLDSSISCCKAAIEFISTEKYFGLDNMFVAGGISAILRPGSFGIASGAQPSLVIDSRALVKSLFSATDSSK